MKAPDKIYIQTDKPTGAMFVNYDRNDENNVEYIRKDALLEDLNDMQSNTLSRYQQAVLELLAKKIKSL